MITTHQKKIQHLYWRAGFGLSPTELPSKTKLTIPQAVEELFQKAQQPSVLKSSLKRLKFSELKKMSKAERRALRKKGRQTVMELNTLWLKQMTEDTNPLMEKMTLFWHGHFACILKNNPYQALQQNNTIRQHALGNFKDLLIAIAKDGGMIRFLNNQQNRKQKPNENFARELNELFTIGRGHYTEQDIKEAARAFTGWSSNLMGDFQFRERWHDYGQKTFMGKTGNFDGTDIIDIILSKKQTAKFIATKVYRFFVNDTVNNYDVEYLADVFYKSNYDIGKLMRTIFESNRFYDAENMGNKIKSPIEFLVGTMKTLNVKFESVKPQIFLQKALGQILFNPPNVAGWAGGKAWIDNATLMLRLNLASYLFFGGDMNIRTKEEFEALQRNKARKRLKATSNPTALVQAFKGKSEAEVFTALSNFLLQPSVKLNQDLVNSYTIQNNQSDYIKTLAMRFMSMPEYQLC